MSHYDPKTISHDFIDCCYRLLYSYKVNDRSAIGERRQLLADNYYIECRIHGKLILCDKRTEPRLRVKSNTYRLRSPDAIANMLSKYLELLNNEGYWDEESS